MTGRRWLASVILAAGLVLATGAIPAAGAAPDPEIRLINQRFTPPAGVPETARQAIARRAEELRARGKERLHLLVQLHELPSPAGRQELARQGLDLGAYVPGSAFIAAAPVGRAVAAVANPRVRWARLWEPGHKLHPRVAAGDWAPWARDPARPENVAVMLLLHHDVPLEDGPALAEKVGGVAMPAVEGLHGMTVWLPQNRVAELAAEEEVLWIEEAPPPLTPTNDGVVSSLRADGLTQAPYNLDGSGVRLFVFDGGSVLSTHETFDPGTGSRVTVIDGQPASPHATHVAGTAAGDGSGSVGSRGRGVAPGVSVLSAGYEQTAGSMLFWDNAGDIETDYASARTLHQADLGTNSLGSNTARNGYPCEREGDYGVSSSLIDSIVHGTNAAVGSPVFMTWAAGNERKDVDGFFGRCGSNYGTTAPPSCAKNPLHVGAVNSDGLSMTEFSSWGPCDDGRLKPTLVAPGCETGRVTGENIVYSSTSDSDSSYGDLCGTSMATPAVAGAAALLVEAWREEGYGGANDRPSPALIKAILIHTARDLGLEGPDYVHGYGAVDAKAAIDLLRGADSLNRGWITDTIEQDEIQEHYINGPRKNLDEVKVTLVWDDPAAAPFAAEALVNDLTLEYSNSSTPTPYQPWVLDPASPHLPATKGVDSLNNVEQIVIRDAPSSDTLMRVIGTQVPQGSQSYALVFSFNPAVIDKTTCAVTSSTFETDTDGWTFSGAERTPAPASGHGVESVRLGGAVETLHEVTRQMVVPSDARSELTFWWYMTTEESLDLVGFGYDPFTVEIRNSSGTVLSVVDWRNDGWPQSTWLQQRIDLTPWAGQTVTLAFTATNDIELVTTFWIDDVTVTSCPRICNIGGPTMKIQVTPVDDPPIAVDDAATVTENSGATAINVLANDTDPDGGPISIASVTQPANGTVAITGCGTGLVYAPNPNYCNNPPGTPDTFTYTLMPGGSTATVMMTVICVNDPPVADPDAFDFIGNTDLVVDLAALPTPHAFETTLSTLGVLDGDSDPEGDAFSVTSITVGACTDASAPLDCSDPAVGRVQMQPNGRFIFAPAPGDTGATETFQYTLTDNGIPAPASAAGTVTLNRFERVWYVKNDAPAGGNGTSSSPFNSITSANLSDNDGDGDLTDDLDSAGDYIFVYYGDGTSANQAGGLVLENNQHLVGEHAGLSLNVNLNGNGAPTNLVAAAAGSRPLLDDTTVDAFEGVSARNVVPIEIVGMNLAGNVNAIDWTTTAAFAGTGTFSIRDNVIRSAAGDGVDMNLAGTGIVNLAFHDNSLTATGSALDIQETGTGSLRITAFDDNVVSGNTGGLGILINNAIFDSIPGGALNTVNGGTTVIGASGNGVGGAGMVLNNVQGDLHFTGNLNIFADGGTGLTVTGTGAGMQFRVNSGGAPMGIIEATGGPALDATATALDLRLTSLRSTNSASTGVSLTNVTGTFSAETGSTITSSTGTDFAISGGTANVTYRGTVTDDVGQLISISGATAGTKSFEGAITDGDDGDGNGVSLSSNTGATIRFSGGLVLSTGANAAFTATGGGTVVVCDENPCNPGVTGALVNKLTTTTGTALNVANTTIGSSRLELRSISSDGATNGIVLNNTGVLGGVTVTGTGAADSGGTIQNTTGSAILATNTQDLSLGWIRISAPGRHGIEATNLRGTCLLSGSTITGFNFSTGNGYRLINTNTDLTKLTISGSTFSSSVTGSDGIFLEARGTSNMTVSVESSCTFTGLFGDAIDAQTITGASGNVNLTVKGSTFTNAAPNGSNGIAINPFGGPANFTFDIDTNVFDTIMRPATNLGAINVTAGDPDGSGPTVTGTIQNNTLNNVIGARGLSIAASTFAGQLDLTVNNNAIDRLGSVSKHGIIVDVRDSVPNADVTVTNNQIGQAADLWTSGAGTANGILLQTQNLATMDALLSGNLVDANTSSALEVVRIRALNSSTLNATVTGNDLQDTNTTHVELAALTGASATAGGTICLNVSGNIVPAAGVGVLRITENVAPGAINVTQASATAVAAANSNATVTVTGTPTFGVSACPLP